MIKLFLLLISLLFIDLWSNEKEPRDESKKTEPNSSNWKKKKPQIVLYGGNYVNGDLIPLLTLRDISYQKSYIAVGGINYPLNLKYKFIDFEVEGQIAKHFGIMNHWEVNTVFVARANDILKTPFSFGFGEGLSLASQNPILENQRKGFDTKSFFYHTEDIQSRPLLNYLLIEFDYTFKYWEYQPRIFMRIHHRSGIWGTFCPPEPPCGSNFLTYGVKLPF